MNVHKFMIGNAPRIEVEQTGLGENYSKLLVVKDQLERDPELSQRIGVDLATPEDPGEIMIVRCMQDLDVRTPAAPVIVIAEDDYFLRAVSPLPRKVHMVSTRAFLTASPRIAQLKAKREFWDAVTRFCEASKRPP